MKKGLVRVHQPLGLSKKLQWEVSEGPQPL